MSRARVEIINEGVKMSNFEDLEVGTVFKFEEHIYLKLESGCEAVLLSQDGYLGCVINFSFDDPVIVYDKAVITVRTRVE